MDLTKLTFTSSTLVSILAYTGPSKIDIYREHRLSGDWMLREVLDDDTLSAQVLSHGCWCQKLNPYSEAAILGLTLGGPETSDELDKLCQNWYAARRCNDQLSGGSCYTLSEDTYYQFHALSRSCVPADHQNFAIGDPVQQQCLFDTCSIDLYFSNQIKQFIEASQLSNTFDDLLSAAETFVCIPSNNGNNVSNNHICVGTVPDLKIERQD